MEHPRILVVDDDLALCELVRSVFELEGLDVFEAHHVVEAERLIVEKVPDAIILDIGLPGVDGLFYCQRLRESPRTRHVPIILISGQESAHAQATASGASAFVRKPFDPLELLTLLEDAIGVTPLGRAFGPGISEKTAGEHTAQLGHLIEVGRRRHDQLNQTLRQTLTVLASSLESRWLETTAHTERVSAYAMRLTLEVAPSLTDDPSLEWGFLLHDVGTIGVPDRILLKRGSLTGADWETLKQHTAIGERLLRDLPLLAGEGLRIVRSHHERWDGTGYPDALAQHKIPLGARIFSVADALEAMTDGRPYRRPLRWDGALARLRKGAGSQFDPDIIDGLTACEPDLAAIRKSWLAQRPKPAPANAPAAETRLNVIGVSEAAASVAAG
jgi:response regulator RpfG family c-di-GMP phosphodiesterase